MHPRITEILLAGALTAPLAFAQTTATYGTYGSGCPGTGTGLGGMQIVPAAAATTFGAGNAIPFGWSPVKYQQVFLGSELPTAFTMAALSLRQPHTGPGAHGFTVDLDIQVGYTTRWQTTLSTTFAANWDAGAPVQVVPRAQIVFPDQLAPPTSPTQFLMTIPWANTFAWVPSPGRNLLIEVTVHGNSVGGSIYGYPIDNVGGTFALYGTPASATTGAIRSFGIVAGIVEQTPTAVPQLYSTDTPQINNSFRVRVAQAAESSFALLLLGFSDTGWGGFTLPFDLGPRGAPGCALLAAPESVMFVMVNAAGYTFFEYGIPNNIYLLGTHFYNQALVADPTVNALGFVTTNGGVGLLGNQ